MRRPSTSKTTASTRGIDAVVRASPADDIAIAFRDSGGLRDTQTTRRTAAMTHSRNLDRASLLRYCTIARASSACLCVMPAQPGLTSGRAAPGRSLPSRRVALRSRRTGSCFLTTHLVPPADSHTLHHAALQDARRTAAVGQVRCPRGAGCVALCVERLLTTQPLVPERRAPRGGPRRMFCRRRSRTTRPTATSASRRSPSTARGRTAR